MPAFVRRLRPHWPVAAVIALTALFLIEGLIPGRVFFHRDLGRQFFPVIGEARLGAGGEIDMLPFWSHASNNGRPHLANPGYSFLSPLSVSWLVLPHACAFDLFLVLHALLGAAGMALLARALGASPASALAAGAAMGLGGGTVSALDLWWALVAFAWAPWVLLSSVRAIEAASPRRFALLALALALQANGGMPEVVVATLLVGAMIGLTIARGPVLRRIARVALTFGGCGIWGILICSPQLLPAALHASTTQRAWGFTAEGVLYNSLDPRAIPGLFLPRWGGHPMERLTGGFPGGAWTDTGTPYLLSHYCGLFACLLAAWALLEGARRRLPAAQAALVPALAFVAAMGLVIALGRHVPPIAGLVDALAPLPLRYTVKALFATFLALPLLAGLGLDAMIARFRSAATARAAGVALALLVAFDLQVAHLGYTPVARIEELAEAPLVSWLKRRAGELEVRDGEWFLHHERRTDGEWGAPPGSLEPTELAVHLWQHRMLMPPLGMAHGIRHAMDRMGDRLEDTCILEATRDAYAADSAEWARLLGEAGVLFVISPDAELEKATGHRLLLETALGADFGVPGGSGFVYRNLTFRPRLEVEASHEGAGFVSSWTDDHRGMTVSVTAARAARLIIRERLLPANWSVVSSTGVPFALRRTEPCWSAIDLPAGEWTIRFEHAPPGWHLSLALCAISLCAAVLALLPSLNRRGAA